MAMNKILGIHNSRVGGHKRQQGQAEATPWKKRKDMADFATAG
jgi:hypothetical protein